MKTNNFEEIRVTNVEKSFSNPLNFFKEMKKIYAVFYFYMK